MRIRRQSILTGNFSTMEVPCTEEQLRNFEAGMHIQHAMPDVPAELREFILTGVTPEEWNEAFKK